jgi:phage gp36-like protein
MAYAVLSDMTMRFGEEELIQLTDKQNMPPEVIGVAAVETALADAQALIDGYVGQVYRLPLSGCIKPGQAGVPDTLVPPPILVRINADLARYYLHDDLSPESEVYRRFKSSVAELEKIGSGEVQLSCPWGGSPGYLIGSDQQTGSAEVLHSFSPRVMTDENLGGYK